MTEEKIIKLKDNIKNVSKGMMIDKEKIDRMPDTPLQEHEKQKKTIYTPVYEDVETLKKEQKQIYFKDYKNYLDFYNDFNNYYDDNDKYIVEGNAHFLSRKNMIEPLLFLIMSGIGEYQIKSSMEFYRYIDIDRYLEDKRYLVLSGKTDSEKTTNLISIALSILTDEKQKRKYYSIGNNNLFLLWDDVIDFEFWKNNPDISNRKYDNIFIDDMFNRDISEWQKDNLITLLRNVERNGTRLFITTNANNKEFFQEIRDHGDSFYSRFNDSLFKFVEKKQKNHRIV